HLRGRFVAAAAGVAALTLLAGPAAYAVTTINHPTTGALASAGPTTPGGGGSASRPFGGQRGPGPGFAGGPGSFGPATNVDRALISYLEAHKQNAKYLVATFGSQSSAPIIIATGEPVMTIGGFSGSDPAP